MSVSPLFAAKHALAARVHEALVRRRSIPAIDQRPIMEWVAANMRTETGQHLDFETHPYMPTILEDEARLKGFMCGSQVGKTTMGIAAVYHFSDTAPKPVRTIYTMHTDKAVEAFAQTRASASIEASPYLAARVGDVNNVHRKTFRRPDGNSVIMFAGASKAAMGLSEPADMVVHDEVDFSNAEVLRLYEDRLAHGYEADKSRFLFGTPTVPGYGLSRHWEQSTQCEWMVKCPECGDERAVTWPDGFAMDIPEPHFLCGRGHKLTWEDDIRTGRWVAMQPAAECSMYRIPRWLTPFWDAGRIVRAFNNETFLQLFMNQVCGVSATSGELEIDEEVLAGCVDLDREESTSAGGGRVFLGADPGKVISWVVGVEGADDTRLYLRAGEAETWADLEQVMKVYRVRLAVVDGAYDPTAAQEFAKKFPRRVFLTYYAKQPLKGTTPVRESEQKGYLDLDRTVTLDRTANRLIMGQDRFPRFGDGRKWERFVSQMTAMVRGVREEEDSLTAEKMRLFFWQEIRPDHWRHAHNYATVAADIMQGKTGVPIPESLQRLLGTTAVTVKAVRQGAGPEAETQEVKVREVTKAEIEGIQKAPEQKALAQRGAKGLTLTEQMYPAMRKMREMMEQGESPGKAKKGKPKGASEEKKP
jgi:plasmid stability protein